MADTLLCAFSVDLSYKGHHGADYLIMADTAAVISGKRLGQFLLRGIWVLHQKHLRAHDDARRTISALECRIVRKSPLQRTQFTGNRVCQTLQGDYGLSVAVCRQNHAFRRCFTMEELILPSSVRVIEEEAFNGCYGLKKVSFQEGLEIIRHRAFWCCPGLREITFPRTLKQIGSRAFECCSMLSRVTFKNEALFIDEYAFNETPYYGKKLREAAEIARISRKKQSAGMSYYNDHGDASVKFDHFTELSLPEGVTHIDHWAYCSSIIEALYLPNSLRTLGMCAFKDCRQLKTISMSPNTYCNYRIRLGAQDGIFAGCTSLEEVTLRGPLKEFTWYDATEPEILHGFDRERTFLHCPSLRRLIAWEIPFSLIPEEWRQYAVNGFLNDPERDTHYLPDIAAQYHEYLHTFRDQLIMRTAKDGSFALHQYLTDHELIRPDEIDQLIEQAGKRKDPEVSALLLDYRKHACSGTSFMDSLFHGFDEL